MGRFCKLKGCRKIDVRLYTNESKYKLNSTPRGRVHIYLRSWRVLARVYARHVACVDSPRPIDTPLPRPCKDIHEAAIKHLPTRCVCTSILILSAISFAYAFVHTIAYRPSWPHIANMHEPVPRFENRPLVTTLASYSPEIPRFGNRSPFIILPTIYVVTRAIVLHK